MPHSPLLAVPDPLCLSKEVMQLQRQVIGLEADRKQLLTENALLRVRLRLYSSPSSLKEPSHSVLKVKKELKQFSKCLCDSQSGSKAATSTPSLDVIPALDERFDLWHIQQAPFEKLAVQCLLNKALSDIDTLAQSLIELERTSQYQQSFSQQLLIELLFMRKQVRTLHVEKQAKSNLLRLVSATHSQTKKLMNASNEEVTRQLLVHLLVFRKDIINRQLLMPSSGTSTITHEITELGILRLSEAELRAEKESLVISLKELLDIIAFRNPFSRSQGQEQEDPPIMELVLALVYAWKSSQQRSITRPQIKAAISRDFVHAADGTSSRSCVSSSRYKPPHRRDVENKTQRPPILAKPSSHCKQAKKNSSTASTGASSILRVDASSFAHVKFVPVRPRKVVESSGFSSSVVGSTYLRWKTFS